MRPRHDVVDDDDLRRLEADADGRLKLVAARFLAIDGRFISHGEWLDRIEHDQRELERRSEARCKAIERRIEALQAQTDEVRTTIATRIDQARRDVTRLVLLGMLATIVTTGLLCGTTILLAL